VPGEIGRKEAFFEMTSLHMAIIDFFIRDEAGQGLVEYGLIISLIAIVSFIALVFIGNDVSTLLSTVGHST